MSEPEGGTLVGERFDKYQLLSLIAVGGTAEIYLARIGGEAGFEKFVVVKCLLDHLAHQPDFIDMFLDEARLGAQLDHTNIVQTLELGEQHGRYYLVMEYLAGMSLATLSSLAQERLEAKMLPLEQSLALCAQACAGLHYAHERKTLMGRPLRLVHRDVSPQNLVVSFEGVLKLVDFGIAKAAVRVTKTKTGTIKGKFAYMAPEQCLNRPVDRRTDIFALGAVLHELVTGKRLFKRDNTYDTYRAIVEGEAPKPSAVNPLLDSDIDELVMRALATAPQDRYPNAEVFGEAIHEVLHRRGVHGGATATARFIEQAFAPEVDLHLARMRELAQTGRPALQDITWNAAEEPKRPPRRIESAEELDFDRRPSSDLAPNDDFIDDQPTRLDDDVQFADDGEAEGETARGDAASREALRRAMLGGETLNGETLEGETFDGRKRRSSDRGATASGEFTSPSARTRRATGDRSAADEPSFPPALGKSKTRPPGPAVSESRKPVGDDSITQRRETERPRSSAPTAGSGEESASPRPRARPTTGAHPPGGAPPTLGQPSPPRATADPFPRESSMPFRADDSGVADSALTGDFTRLTSEADTVGTRWKVLLIGFAAATLVGLATTALLLNLFG